MSRKKEFLIYGLIDPRTSELRYVGKSSRGLTRPRMHTTAPALAKNKFWSGNWLRELVSNGLQPEIIVIENLSSFEEIAEAEMFWIAYFKSIGVSALTNMTLGGEGTWGYKHSDETRKRQSEIAKASERQKEHRAQLAKAWKGSKHTPEVLAIITRSSTGRKHSPEIRAKISAANKGQIPTKECLERWKEYNATRGPMSLETRLKISIANYNKPTQKIIDSNGVIYSSQRDAVKKTGVSATYVSQIVNGKLQSTRAGLSFRRYYGE